jgi:hypothetical protein
MGIDRIGKNAPVPAPEVGGRAGIEDVARPAGHAFQVPTAGAHQATGAAAVDPARPAGPLERLRAGEVDLGGYVDLKVHEATAHLASLPPVELEKIRTALREKLANDPELVDLLRTATGEVLQPDDD